METTGVLICTCMCVCAWMRVCVCACVRVRVQFILTIFGEVAIAYNELAKGALHLNLICGAQASYCRGLKSHSKSLTDSFMDFKMKEKAAKTLMRLI